MSDEGAPANTPFVPGLRLSELFYAEAVKPILDARFPDLRYEAALIGYGSEVLGFDTARSTDHHWGPRLLLFLADEDIDAFRTAIDAALRSDLPRAFRGYPTNFGPPDEIGVRLMRETDAGVVDHMIELTTVRSFFRRELGLDVTRPIEAVDWLTLSEQKLREVTAGTVFYDGLGELEEVRGRVRYYPRDVWLALLAAQWSRIGEEEAFVGRCGEVGDDLGSRLVAARLVRDLMRLGFLIERTYAPYDKWFGSAFVQLACGAYLGPILQAVLRADDWRTREHHLSRAYAIVAELHNGLGITAPLPTAVSPYYDRPYQVIHGGRFAAAIRDAIADDGLRGIAAEVGSVNQLIDATDQTANPALCRRLRVVYEDASVAPIAL